MHEAVSGVSFALPPGERMVLAGPSGAGKSTVLAAILRTLPAARGAVTLDGHDTATMAGEDVRARIGWCGPAAHLFDSTLRENLRLARPDATDDDLVDALHHARLGAWLTSLPDGLDTALGEHGGPVSGGERQRLAVARVLLADRPVLALDEPTAHLDAPTARALAGEIAELSRGRTAIVVSHRPAEFPDLPVVTVANAGIPGVPGPRRGARPHVLPRPV
jgi:ATP-binding cassette subfamily C protein CydCD